MPNRLTLRIRITYHRLLLWLFPRLKEHENNLNSIDFLKRENSRHLAEIVLLTSKESQARAEAQTANLSARSAIDKASQLSLANEQLQSQLLDTTRLMADRIERAYGGTFNWAALGGFSSRRVPYPWLPTTDPPEIKPIDTKGAIGRSSLRGEANRLAAETQTKMKERMANPKLQEAMDETFLDVQRKLQSGELMIDASGQVWPNPSYSPDQKKAG